MICNLRTPGVFVILFSGIFVVITGCSSKYILFTSLPDEANRRSYEVDSDAWSQDFSATHSPKIINTYFHFFNSADSTLNYQSDKAPEIVRQLLNAANRRLKENDKMNLPEGNKTEVYDTRISYELHSYGERPGIFYHYQDPPDFFIKQGKNANRYDRKVIKKYAITEDSVLNVFIMPFDPDQLASGEQKVERTAIALGHTIKIPGIFQSQSDLAEYAGMFNHELGHVLSLRHSWDSNDSCDDTPLNDNCWFSTGDPPCQGITSNNVMDYNAFQSAFTPCQIAKMHAVLSDPGRPAHKMMSRNWCDYLQDESIIISGQRRWSQPKLIMGDIIINKGGILYITSMMHMASGARIKIKKGGTLILKGATFFNSCGDNWDGILCHRNGQIITLGENNVLKQIHHSSSDNMN